jgi:peptide/nickel transport system substrate-binding protein/oligopeptide transport system substrate-binding protein
MFVLNASRPLFRNNVKLRQAVNFAVDRVAIAREFGPLLVTPTDQYLAYLDARIYPLKGPDLGKARALAKGHRRGGKAVLYTRDDPVAVAQAQILERNLSRIGIEVEIHAFPGNLLFEKLKSGQHDFDIGRAGFGFVDPPQILSQLFDGRTIGRPDNVNWSYFNSPKYNRLLDRAASLTGEGRYRAYGELDVQLSRDAAPAIPLAFANFIAFVSRRTGCVVLNPAFDLTAVCLK